LKWDGVGEEGGFGLRRTPRIQSSSLILELAKIGTRQRYARGATVLMILLLFEWRPENVGGTIKQQVRGWNL
jgi:hypothetical protein